MHFVFQMIINLMAVIWLFDIMRRSLRAVSVRNASMHHLDHLDQLDPVGTMHMDP